MRITLGRVLPGALIILVILLIIPAAMSADGFSLTLKTKSTEVVRDIEFRVVVEVAGTPDLACFGPLEVTYDPAVFQYTRSLLLSGKVQFEEAVSGDTVILNGYSESGGGITIDGPTYLVGVYFKGIKSGSGVFQISKAEGFAGDDLEPLPMPTGASITITVTEPVPKSGNNNLKSLSIDPGSLTPAFSAGQVSYTAQLSAEVSKLTVSAVPEDSKAAVAVSGNDVLKEGENTINVVVTAENGAKKTYTITATRAAPAPTPSPTPVPTPSPMPTPALTVQLSGGVRTISEPPEGTPIPAGFYRTLISISNRMVPAFQSLNGNLTLFYLTDAAGNAGFYSFDNQSKAYKPFQVLNIPAMAYSVLNLDPGVTLPQGYAEKALILDGQSLTAWQKVANGSPQNGASGQYLLYLMDNQGTKGFFLYNPVTNLLTSYPKEQAVTATPTVTATPSATPTITPEAPLAVASSFNSWQLIAVLLGVLCLTLISLLIWLAIRLNRERSLGYADASDSYDYPEPAENVNSRRPPLKAPTIRRVE
jgi:hypothetical protein